MLVALSQLQQRAPSLYADAADVLATELQLAVSTRPGAGAVASRRASLTPEQTVAALWAFAAADLYHRPLFDAAGEDRRVLLNGWIVPRACAYDAMLTSHQCAILPTAPGGPATTETPRLGTVLMYKRPHRPLPSGVLLMERLHELDGNSLAKIAWSYATVSSPGTGAGTGLGLIKRGGGWRWRCRYLTFGRPVRHVAPKFCAA